MLDKLRKFNEEKAAQPNIKYNLPESSMLKGWKFFVPALFIGSVFLASLWPVIFDPIVNINLYKKQHEMIEAELAEFGMQPGQLKKFENPWKKKAERKE